MGISNFTLTRLFNDLYEKIINAKIERIVNVSDTSYILSLFKDNKTSNLLLSLDPSLPIFLYSSYYRVDSINTPNYGCNMLRKYLDHAVITKFNKVNDDRIIEFEARKWNQSYQLIEVKIIFEMFPLAPNIIVIDKNNVILDAIKRSISIDCKHPIFKGLSYVYPPATNKDINPNSKIEDLIGKVNKSELNYLKSLSENEYTFELNKMLNETKYFHYKNDVSSLKINDNFKETLINDLFIEIVEKKKDENKSNKFEDIYKLIDSKIKSINKRIINLNNDLKKFNNYQQYQEIGDLLYTATNIHQRGLKDIIIEDTKIILDPKLDINENAQKYYKLYKKGKSGINQIDIQINHAKEELDYFERLKLQLTFASFNDIEEIILDLIENHYIKNHKISNKAKKKPGNKKYSPHILKCGSTKIGYGLSSFQNEELTFNMANKNDTYLHVKDYHGPHVIIFNDNPSEDELLLGAEIALYFANKTAGEVYYTKRHNIKKVPNKRGLVTMSSYSVIVINNIREETLKLLKGY